MASGSVHSVASVYAGALFELVTERDQTATVREEFAGIAAVIKQNPEFARFMETPAISRDQKRQTLKRLFENRVGDLLLDFLMVLVRKDRLDILVPIHQVFEEMLDRKEGRVRGTLTTAVALSDKQEEAIRLQLSAAMNKTVSLKTRVEPDLIGGMVLMVDDTLIDGSVRRKLQLLGRKLHQAGAGQMNRAENYLVE